MNSTTSAIDTTVGKHIIFDIWDSKYLNDLSKIEEVLIHAAKVSGATVLHSYLHPFEPSGVSGVVVLAESHISIHTWPEDGYAALDIFMCGEANATLAVEYILKQLEVKKSNVQTIYRGAKLTNSNN